MRRPPVTVGDTFIHPLLDLGGQPGDVFTAEGDLSRELPAAHHLVHGGAGQAGGVEHFRQADKALARV